MRLGTKKFPAVWGILRLFGLVGISGVSVILACDTPQTSDNASDDSCCAPMDSPIGEVCGQAIEYTVTFDELVFDETTPNELLEWIRTPSTKNTLTCSDGRNISITVQAEPRTHTAIIREYPDATSTHCTESVSIDVVWTIRTSDGSINESLESTARYPRPFTHLSLWTSIPMDQFSGKMETNAFADDIDTFWVSMSFDPYGLERGRIGFSGPPTPKEEPGETETNYEMCRWD